jgi:GNAT superfamily N-acetyltransferase
VIVVTPAEPADAEDLAALAEEMDHFYGATQIAPLAVRLRQISDALFNAQPTAFALLARDNGQLVGFAAYSFLWPAVGLTRSLFLKELYVAQAARRSGIGEQLMRAIFDIAVKNDCSRVEWQTENTNLEARAFYAKLGAAEFAGKVFYRVGEESLQYLLRTET